jgi:hypothetical protein
MLDFSSVLGSRYSEKLEQAHRRAKLEAQCQTELRAAFIAALRRGPDAVVHMPGKKVETIAQLVHEEIGSAQLAALLRAAERGENVQTHARLLLDTVATKHANYHAGDLADERDGS